MTINCDLGEGVASESLLLNFIDRASVACGGHYGNYDTISHTIQQASAKNIFCGAHPSFPDKENFGRKPIDITPEKLLDSIINQLTLFLEAASKNNIEIDHIKAHGALYNLMMEDMELAETLLGARDKLGLTCPVFALCKSTFYQQFHSQVPLLTEAFVDRKYTSDYKLTSRSMQGAVIQQPDEAHRQFTAFRNHTAFYSIEAEELKLAPDTVCIHGDNPAAVSILQHIRNV